MQKIYSRRLQCDAYLLLYKIPKWNSTYYNKDSTYTSSTRASARRWRSREGAGEGLQDLTVAVSRQGRGARPRRVVGRQVRRRRTSLGRWVIRWGATRPLSAGAAGRGRRAQDLAGAVGRQGSGAQLRDESRRETSLGLVYFFCVCETVSSVPGCLVCYFFIGILCVNSLQRCAPTVFVCACVHGCSSTAFFPIWELHVRAFDLNPTHAYLENKVGSLIIRSGAMARVFKKNALFDDFGYLQNYIKITLIIVL
jgi:hypothetical protein